VIVAYGVVVGGDKNTPNVDYSVATSDGVNWVTRVQPTTLLRPPTTIFGNGTQVIGVDAATIATTPIFSTNGLDWTPGPLTSFPSLTTYSGFRKAVWTGAGYVVAYTLDLVFSSPDGLTWTRKAPPHTVAGFAWTGSRLVSLGIDGVIFTSDDGNTWIQRTTAVPDGYFQGLVWNGAQIIATGDVHTGDEFTNYYKHSLLRTSSDGISWATRPVARSANNHTLLWDGDALYGSAGSWSVGGAHVERSKYGVVWSAVTPFQAPSHGAPPLVAEYGRLFYPASPGILSAPTLNPTWSVVAPVPNIKWNAIGTSRDVSAIGGGTLPPKPRTLNGFNTGLISGFNNGLT
jgi:hypothetical protein